MATPVQSQSTPPGKVLLLKESEVRQLLTMDLALEAVEKALRAEAFNEGVNIVRGRAQTDHAMLHCLGGAIKVLGAMGAKVYSTSKKHPSRFLIPLFDGKTAALLALIQADHLGQVRTGAASGIATRFMARPDADDVGVFGSGKQARTQIEAMCKVRKVARISVYSPNEERRQRFATEMTASLGVPVEAVAQPELAARGKHIICTATNARDPVLNGEWIEPGTHLNLIGSNFLARAEADVETLRKANRFVIDSKDQGHLEAGDFQVGIEANVLKWSQVIQLGEIVVGRQKGRDSEEEITIFKSLGLGIEDVATAIGVYRLAVQQSVGTWIDWE